MDEYGEHLSRQMTLRDFVLLICNDLLQLASRKCGGSLISSQGAGEALREVLYNVAALYIMTDQVGNRDGFTAFVEALALNAYDLSLKDRDEMDEDLDDDEEDDGD